MGRKMDALLRRGFRASKFKNLAKLALTRLAILKNQRQVRSSNARFDVLQLLNLGHQDRALLRVEHVIKEENMLGLFVMMEGFINLLMERITLLQDNKECPEELEEAIASLIFAATRCGEFPELKHIRETFASRFGKDFDTSASEVRNSCKVHPQMIQRLTTRKPTMEKKMRMLEEIASEHGITIESGSDRSDIYQVHEKQDVEAENTSQEPPTDLYKLEAEEEINILVARLSESIKAKKFGGAADAAQEAFQAAAHAAVAARAAVELSRTDSDYSDDSDQEINNSTNELNDSDDDQELIIHESAPKEIKNSNDQGHQELIIHESAPEEIKNSTDGRDQDHQEPKLEEIKNSTDGKDQDHQEPKLEEIKNSTDDGLVVFSKMGSRNGSGSESDDQEEFYSFRNQEVVTLYYETEPETETEAEFAVTSSRNDSNMEPNEDSSNEIVETMNHGTDRKHRLESRRTFSNFGQQSGVDRKLMSVKTTPVLRG